MFAGYDEIIRREHENRVRWANCYGWMVQRVIDSRPDRRRKRSGGQLTLAIVGVTLAAILAGTYGITIGIASVPAPYEIISGIELPGLR